ncbi:uncharacterized protein [Clinocottus analis]|uniref:uncharacterized protein n=1 Tax=Clinocottus analis TaxID=304258 RepID=UPI0035BF130E
MEGTRTTLWLFLLLIQLPLCPADADPTVSTEWPQSYETNGATAGRTDPPAADANGTRADCLIDTEMGLIAVGSAGGLIVCLLVTTAVLACQIWVLQRRGRAPRASRSNMDLVSSTGYWGVVDRPEEEEAGGLLGPCDASVVLEEVRADGEPETERRAEGRQARPEDGAAKGYEEKQMQSSSSRDSCLETPRDLEDMPLVV